MQQSVAASAWKCKQRLACHFKGESDEETCNIISGCKFFREGEFWTDRERRCSSGELSNMVDVKVLPHESLGDQMRLGRNLQNPVVLMENTTH
jgi:hypothetical protein